MIISDIKIVMDIIINIISVISIIMIIIMFIIITNNHSYYVPIFIVIIDH